ncbi:MAG: hypothetical protein KA160_10680 [Lacibacter sp.]|nr:hypothetical protein [Lacibacter sp.]
MTQKKRLIELSVEPYKQKQRLVVTDQGNEWVCRIESIRNLEMFLQQEQASIFKGRLRLHKHSKEISVEIKGNIVLQLTVASFRKMIERAKAE